MSVTRDIRVGELHVRPHEHVVLVRDDPVDLTSREYAILLRLAEHPGWVFSADELSDDPVEGDYSPESVSVLVSRLRRKLARAGVKDAVETVRGSGYRIKLTLDPADSMLENAAACRELRDAAWQLQEAVIECEHSGNLAQVRAAIDALEVARRSVFSTLAE